MATNTRTILLPSNAVNMVVAVNTNVITNFKLGNAAEFSLPDLVQRALMVHYETGVMPIVETITR